MVDILFSFWEGLFSGAMLVLGRVVLQPPTLFRDYVVVGVLSQCSIVVMSMSLKMFKKRHFKHTQSELRKAVLQPLASFVLQNVAPSSSRNIKVTYTTSCHANTTINKYQYPPES